MANLPGPHPQSNAMFILILYFSAASRQIYAHNYAKLGIPSFKLSQK